MHKFRLMVMAGTLLVGCALGSSNEMGPLDVTPFGLAACGRDSDRVGSATAPRNLDVVVALDSSRSTGEPTGVDIDRDGHVARRRLVRDRWGFGFGSSDEGDTYLGAQVAGVRSLVRGVQGQGHRFSVVAWAGTVPDYPSSSDIRFATPLLSDPGEIESALRQLFELSSFGNSNLAAAIDQGVSILASSESRGVLLLISDAPSSYPPGEFPDWEPAVERAIEHSIRIDTFAIGSEATRSPQDLEEISSRTGGTFRAVTRPDSLACSLATSLLADPPLLGDQRSRQ